MIVNRDLERDIEIKVELNGFSPATEATVYVLNGPAIDATNEEKAENVTIRESTIDTAVSFAYTVTKHSVTVIELTADYADGSQMTDYATAFTVTTYPVSDGSVTVVLGEDPVLVEEVEGERVYLPLISNAVP